MNLSETENINVSTTKIYSIPWLVAWNANRERHEYLQNADLVFSNDTIDYVGWDYPGEADVLIDGSNLMIAPGLVNLHTHPWSETLHKGCIEDFGNPALGMMAMYDMMPGWVDDPEAWRHVATVAYSELLCSGVTSLVDISPIYDGWVDLAADSGMRSFLAPSMASASWSLKNANEYQYHWFDDQGEASFRRGIKVIDEALKRPGNRLSGMVFPAQVDTCSENFFINAKAAARERNLTMQTHASQSVPEYWEMKRRHGKSPLAWLDELGMLDQTMTIGHGIFLDHHSWIDDKPAQDLNILADTGTSVAHSPTVFLRTAAALESFAGYRRKGINVALATDAAPNNMLEELRQVLFQSRVNARNLDGSETSDVFHAATIGGAMALNRSDIGRLAAGSKADFFCVNIHHPLMQPLRDPLRNLLHYAAERVVEDVYVGGEKVVSQGKVGTLDYDRSNQLLTQLSQRCRDRIPDYDPLARNIDTLAPLSIELKTRLE